KPSWKQRSSYLWLSLCS
ncbi:acrB/AcrD/AcrF family protein, partial [Vibrio parahaemolyticus V-223/04]